MKILILFLSFFLLASSHFLKINKNRHKNVNCNYPYPVYMISRSTGYYLGRSTQNNNIDKLLVELNYKYDKWALCGYGDPGSLLNLEVNKFLSWRFDKNTNDDLFFLSDPNPDYNLSWGFDYDIDRKFYTIWNNACNNCYLTADTTSRRLSLKPLKLDDPEQQWTLFVMKE